MIEFVPFRMYHLRRLEVQDRHKKALQTALEIDPAYQQVIERSYAWTAMARTNLSPDHVRFDIVACGGITEGWAWAFLSKDLRRYMVALTRRAAEGLAAHTAPVAAHVDESFPAGVRWATLLGFERLRPNVWVYVDDRFS